MARIRSIKPEFWTDYKLAMDLSRDQRLFYVGLWNEADDEGRFLAHPRRLLGAIFPYDEDLTEEWVSESLRTLQETGRLVLYEVEGEPYAQLTKFTDHQKINRPTKSRIPSPSSISANIMEPSMSGNGTIKDGSLRARKEQGTGSVEQGAGNREDESDEPIRDLWDIWLDELGGEPPHPRWNSERHDKIQALYREQLVRVDDPLDTFRGILRCVKASDHHMSNRAYQFPESLFKNESRRDRWVQKALKGNGIYGDLPEPDRKMVRDLEHLRDIDLENSFT